MGRLGWDVRRTGCNGWMLSVERGRRSTTTTSQCCMAVSIDTRTAVARFLGWFWRHTHARVGVPPGFWKTPSRNPVVGPLAPSYAPASPSKPSLTSSCPLAPSDSPEATRAQWEMTTMMLQRWETAFTLTILVLPEITVLWALSTLITLKNVHYFL